MAIDTFIAYSGVYADLEDALADYDAVHTLHTELGLIDAYDAPRWWSGRPAERSGS